jgi:hypothetical protein
MGNGHGGERQGSSRVPGDVHGPHRAIRFIARQPPRTTPSRAITISEYLLHVGVKRQRIPIRAAGPASARW